MYRLFIDIPIAAATTEEAVEKGHHLANSLLLSDDAKVDLDAVGIEQINYRLGHDEDRQNRNYFVIDSAGHASTKKTKVKLTSE